MFNQQKARWMMLGWLSRCKHLIWMASCCNYADKDGRSKEYFTLEQRRKLRFAFDLCSEVLREIQLNK